MTLMSNAPSSEISPKNQALRTALLVALAIFITELIGALTGEKLALLFKQELHLSAGDVGTLHILVGIPSYLQPFVGAWADLFPLFGFNRRSYFVLGALLDAFGFCCLSFLHTYHYATVVGLLILTASGGIMLWVMTNAVMVAVGNMTGSFGRLQSTLMFVPAIMQMAFTSHLGGYAAEKMSYATVFMLAALLSLARGSLFGLMVEPKRQAVTSSVQVDEARRDSAERKLQERAKTAQALRKAAATQGLWVIVAYVFYLILTPGLNLAEIYFEQDALKFSPQFIGDLGIYKAMGALVAIAGFGLFSRRLPISALVWGAWIMDTLGYLCQLQVRDAHSAQMFLGLATMVGTIYGLCLYTLAARACPPGIEGTVYGLVLATIAFAGTMSNKIGSSLYEFFGPAHGHTITHGWIYGQWSGFALTVVGFVFIPFLPAWTRSRERMGDAADRVKAEMAASHFPADENALAK